MSKFADSTHRRGSRYGSRRWMLPILSVLMVSSSTVLIQVSSSASTSGGFGAIPYGLPIQSRCQGMTVSSHVVFSGQYVIGHTHGGICGVTGKDNSWGWSIAPGKGVKGCGKDATYCEFKASASTNEEYTTLCINGANVQGGWTSCDYYGVVGDNMGLISGYVTDKDGGPVSGTDIRVYGPGGTSATSGYDGYFAMQVLKGRYRVVPSGGPAGKKSPSYDPTYVATVVHPGVTSAANFQLQSSIELKLNFKQSTVLATGYEVVSGTITTTQFGKPLPNVSVQLQVQPSLSATQSVTTGVRASVCTNGSRIWPTSALNDPDGYPVTITTDATGTYNFSVTVGTTPGKWTLDAWAFNANGKLSTDVSAASDTKSISVTSNGSSSLSGFVNELDQAAKATTFSTSLSNDAGSANNMWTLLSQVTKSGAHGINFGGLAYSLVNAKDGQAMIIFPEGKPPIINKASEIPSALTQNADDLVYDPAEWTGAGIATKLNVNIASLPNVLAAGLLTRLPTLQDFHDGTSVPGWKTVRGNEMTLFSGNFEFLGWGYPGSTPGSCF